MIVFWTTAIGKCSKELHSSLLLALEILEHAVSKAETVYQGLLFCMYGITWHASFI
jgi:hypothetical protein